MKSIRERLNDTKPKNAAKIVKAFENGGCSCYQVSFINEVNSSTAVDFPNLKCIVTDNYFGCYDKLGVAFSNAMVVIPLNQIANLYRTNIDADNTYNYSFFHLAVELTNGSRKLMTDVSRNKKTFMGLYGDLIECVRNRKRAGNLEV